jgi:hypothetical protein
MSREDDDALSPEQEWRARQEATEQLLRHLSKTAVVPDAEDEEMLSLLINDALQGVDVTRRYPVLYRRILAIPELREAFFDAMDLLQKSRSGQLETIPGGPSEDLSFLNEFMPVDAVTTREGSGGERLLWHRSREQMQALFDIFAPFLQLAPFRLDEELGAITLLQAAWPPESGRLTLQLEAWQGQGHEDALHLALVALALEARGSSPLPGLQADLEWADYQGSARFDCQGRADLPVMPISAVLDENGRVKADLRLIVGKPS